MFKEFSRRYMRFFAIACLTLTVVCLWGAESANPQTTASFSTNQHWDVTGPIGSGICAFNLNTQVWTCFPSPGTSPYTITYTLPAAGQAVAYILYDVTAPTHPQVFQKAIYLFRQGT